jgi:UDP-2,3-diacylglucosamine pyrophosphatase LpxH
MKVLILSDLHLGNPASKANGLMDGIARIARLHDRVILNGDTLDRYEDASRLPHVSRDLDAIKAACTSRSGPPEILSGNHDPALSSVHWIYIKESKTLIFHGDCIADLTHPTDKDDNRLAAFVRKHWSTIGGRPTRFTELADTYRRLQGEHLRDNPRVEGYSAFVYLARLLYPPRRAFDVLSYVYTAPYRAAELAGAHDDPVEHVIVGHTHRAGTWSHQGRTVMNTGSFMPLSQPSAVVIENHRPVRYPLARLIRSYTTTVQLAVSGELGK